MYGPSKCTHFHAELECFPASSNLLVGPRVLTMNDTVRVKVEVTNTGARSGDEVVPFCIRDDGGSVTRPVKELKAFKRITLSPGQTRQVAFTLLPEELAFYDRSMRRVVEPGTVTAMIDTLRAGFTIVRTNR